MANFLNMRGIFGLILLPVCVIGTACRLGLAENQSQPPVTANTTVAPQDGPSLIIENESELPDTFPHASYELRFRAHGGVPVLHWRLEKGALPQGLRLEDDGLLHGQPERTGEFQ